MHITPSIRIALIVGFSALTIALLFGRRPYDTVDENHTLQHVPSTPSTCPLGFSGTNPHTGRARSTRSALPTIFFNFTLLADTTLCPNKLTILDHGGTASPAALAVSHLGDVIKMGTLDEIAELLPEGGTMVDLDGRQILPMHMASRCREIFECKNLPDHICRWASSATKVPAHDTCLHEETPAKFLVAEAPADADSHLGCGVGKHCICGDPVASYVGGLLDWQAERK